MEIKLVEIRDAGTFIPAMAVRLKDRIDEEQYLLRRSGFGTDGDCIMLTRLETGQGQYDPYDWPANPRTMRYAHHFIVTRWEEIRSGDVIDVEFIMGVTKQPKVSERLTNPL